MCNGKYKKKKWKICGSDKIHIWFRFFNLFSIYLKIGEPHCTDIKICHLCCGRASRLIDVFEYSFLWKTHSHLLWHYKFIHIYISPFTSYELRRSVWLSALYLFTYEDVNRKLSTNIRSICLFSENGIHISWAFTFTMSVEWNNNDKDAGQ